MRPWTRLQDWGTLLAGLYAALSPIWVSTTGERDAFWALIVLGALLAVTALSSLALPGVVATEWLAMLFGVLLFVAPWVLTYTDRVGASWTSWVVGAIAVVLGAITVGTSNRRRPAGDPALGPVDDRDAQGNAGGHRPRDPVRPARVRLRDHGVAAGAGLLRHRRGHCLRAAGQDRAARPRRRGEDPVREGAAAQGVFAQRSGTGYLEEFWRTWSFLTERLEQLREGGR